MLLDVYYVCGWQKIRDPEGSLCLCFPQLAVVECACMHTVVVPVLKVCWSAGL